MHKRINQNELRQEVVAGMCRDHQLSLCPLCGGNLATEWNCEGGSVCTSKAGDENSAHWSYFCPSCKIVWMLSIINSVHEHWAYIEKHHTLALYAQWYCQCRAPVLAQKHILDDACMKLHGLINGHSVLGQQCVVGNRYR